MRREEKRKVEGEIKIAKRRGGEQQWRGQEKTRREDERRDRVREADREIQREIIRMRKGVRLSESVKLIMLILQIIFAKEVQLILCLTYDADRLASNSDISLPFP